MDESGIPEHSALRKSYGDQVSSRDAVVKAAQADQGVPQHMGFGEVLSAAEMAHGLATLNPATVGAGGMLLALKKAYKYWESPNRRVEAAFKKLDNSRTQAKPTAPGVVENLKQSVKAAGGGKKGVAATALQIGVPATVLAEFILGDDKKKRKLLTQYESLGGI